MDALCHDLIRIDRWYSRKHAYVRYGIKGAHKPSRMQTSYESLHPTNATDYTILRQNGGFVVSSGRGEYFVAKNDVGCREENCLVKCSQCLITDVCSHAFVCNCMSYCLLNMCKHCHLVAMSNERKEDAGPTILFDNNGNLENTSVFDEDEAMDDLDDNEITRGLDVAPMEANWELNCDKTETIEV